MDQALPSPPSAIRDQVRLPISAAWEIVVQSIRIRLGRSLVTMTGVILGVAFLMSILAANIIRSGVAEEIKTRQTLVAMAGFLSAETGLLRGQSLAVYQGGTPDPLETRFLEFLRGEGIGEIAFVTADTPPKSSGGESSALLVVGDGNLPEAVWASAAPSLRQKLAIFTRPPEATPPGVTPVRLQREPNPEEIAKLEAERRRQNVRTIWIVTIAALVTTISISNALLMSVTERFREIGTMKCLGALSSFIRLVFFIESALLGLSGSLLGALFGLAFSLALYCFSFGWGLVFASMHWPGILVSFVICVGGGIAAAIVAAIYPASFASRMVPATALRTSI